ncbi:MAG: hypothetical protein ACJ72W_00840 [Actinoallomurus sp.]
MRPESREAVEALHKQGIKVAMITGVLPMAVGAILMSSSTMIVAINAQFLRCIDLRPAAI